MSDREGPGAGGDRFDVVERLRRKLEGLRAAETEAPEAGDTTAKVTRLPRRPRRMTDDSAERPRRTWDPEANSAHDPAPTRPVLRSELEQQTGWFPADLGRAQHPPAEEGADRRRAQHPTSSAAADPARRAQHPSAADDTDRGQPQPPAPQANTDRTDHDASVIDLAAQRRNRATNAPAGGPRRAPRPRRISSTDTGQGSGDPDSPRPDGPPQR